MSKTEGRRPVMRRGEAILGRDGWIDGMNGMRTGWRKIRSLGWEVRLGWDSGSGCMLLCMMMIFPFQ